MKVNTDFARFADLVHKMRMAQEHYFKLRRTGAGSGQALAIAKKLEAQVDAAVIEISRIRPVDEVQGDLFDTTPRPASAMTNGT